MDPKNSGGKEALWPLGLIAAILVLAGCGGAAPSSPSLSAIDLESPALQANGELKPSTRCGWGSLWVPLQWGKVPEDTKELAVYLGRFKYVNEHGKRRVVVQFADLVSKFEPSEHRLVANVLPEDISWSYFGTNCVTARRGQKLLLEVFALDRIGPRQITRAQATRLTEEALAHPRATEGAQPPGKPLQGATAVGRLITGYTTGPH
ncbi:MAG TPA: hypothetical protein VGH58_08180 [Solirubrobacterales bacterium]|jgi:hypothetical protein